MSAEGPGTVPGDGSGVSIDLFPCRAWLGPEASLRLVLRVSGHEGNGAASPDGTTTL